jgi:hypothetical protein
LSYFSLRFLTAGGLDEQRAAEVIRNMSQNLQTTITGTHGFIRFFSARKPMVE